MLGSYILSSYYWKGYPLLGCHVLCYIVGLFECSRVVWNEVPHDTSRQTYFAIQLLIGMVAMLVCQWHECEFARTLCIITFIDIILLLFLGWWWDGDQGLLCRSCVRRSNVPYQSRRPICCIYGKLARTDILFLTLTLWGWYYHMVWNSCVENLWGNERQILTLPAPGIDLKTSLQSYTM